MRGKPLLKELQEWIPGITPADAGKTVLRMSARPKFQDHPRGCGENGTPCLAAIPATGSPPRMRGKRMCVTIKTKTPQDHPRGCGENVSRTDGNPWHQGSPPRMRGKHARSAAKLVAQGITPADAGKTYCTKQIACGI